MIEENAWVIAIENDMALIEVQRKAVCDTCAVNNGCGTGILAKAMNNRRFQMKVRNTVDACVGDEVIVGIEDDMLIKSSFAVYIIPLLLLFIGAWIGENSAGAFPSSSPEGLSVLFGMAGLVAGFAWVRYFSKRISSDDRYQPLLLKRKDTSGYKKIKPAFHRES